MSTHPCSRTELHPVNEAGNDNQRIYLYREYLEARRHTAGTVQAYSASVGHFLNWLGQQPDERRAINADSVYRFIRNHLPACRCSQPAPRHLVTVRAALNQLLLMLGQERRHHAGDSMAPAIESLVHQFDNYLDTVCGLALHTRRWRCRVVSHFLADRFGDQPLVFEHIDTDSLIRFITDLSDRYQPATLGSIACALRSFLRYLQFSGRLPSALGTDLPSPANWRLAMLPPSMDEGELARFWGAFDCTTPIGKRDYAMARCLADLALRCHEVAALCLDDIDWRAGALNIRQAKCHRVDRLPLPAITRRALVDYLQQGRPPTASRAVFVYHRAPCGVGVQNTTVRSAVRRAYGRAQLAFTGTHILRHTAATRMVQQGIPIKTVADVLRHRSIDTTMIYAKVDLPQLSSVALPWPEPQP